MILNYFGFSAWKRSTKGWLVRNLSVLMGNSLLLCEEDAGVRMGAAAVKTLLL